MSAPFSSETRGLAWSRLAWWVLHRTWMIKRAVRDCGDCELLVRGVCVFGPKKLGADSVITSQDSVANEVSFVRKGVVALTVLTSEGDQAHVAVRGPRSLLGLESLRQLPSPAEVTAVTEVELCVAPAEKVRSWVGPETGARRMFELAVGELLDQRRDVDFRSGSAEARVARFLLVCGEHIGRGKEAAFSKMRAASVLGLRPETLSRVLKGLAQRGLILTTPALKIVDPNALRIIAAA
jgi:CRP-like cAMP-binding protein